MPDGAVAVVVVFASGGGVAWFAGGAERQVRQARWPWEVPRDQLSVSSDDGRLALGAARARAAKTQPVSRRRADGVGGTS